MSARSQSPPGEPQDVEGLFQTAGRLHAATRIEEAAAVLRQLLAADAAHAGGLNLLGIIHGQRDELNAARELVTQAIAADGSNPVFLRNLCELHRLAGAPLDGVEAGRRAVLLAPNDAASHLNLAMAAADALLLDIAVDHAERALAIDPHNASAHFLRAQINLMAGRFTEGWRGYAWRWQIPGARLARPSGSVPEWTGEGTQGRILLVADQGFGDIIQFARYLPWARSRCGSLAVHCPPELRSLIRRLMPDAHFVTELEETGADACAPLSSLPAYAGTTEATIPSPEGYLRPDPSKTARWAARLDQLVAPGLRRIGLVWAGRKQHRADMQRSMRLAQFAPVLARSGVVFVALQKGSAAREAGEYFGPVPLVNLGPELADFDDTAACLAALDMTVTVDTAVAHLAGALGHPVRILLPHRPDWRWLLNRSDTPWYASARLYRDPAPSDRAGSVALLAADLPLV